MEEYLTMKEIEKSIKLTKPYIYKLILKEKFPLGIKIGRARRWRKSEVEAFIKQHELK